ncbi:hypothetical protein B0E46_16445 [Rhodanobacter sp. B04]|uniref:hypothetical protein n=1 Tax=Rhodanobacter sp. B04 TaxID=1945860 RepID=UPI00098556D9|nr:hypothetical protein [Rhodanobacter sp. B04]OOG61554.1 hypothetical protein B0E46_16445 [Rhodanobacter sp. B04]
MCSYLLDTPDESRKVTELQLGPSDVDTWLSLIDGNRHGQVNVSAESLRIVDMDYGGEAPSGYLSTWGQTGCTVIVAIQRTGSNGHWAYFNHVNSGMIEQGLGHASDAISRLATQDNITFVIMGGMGGTQTYKSLLRSLFAQGAGWNFIVLTKPENGMEESVLGIESCMLALTKNLVSRARHEGRQFMGFQPQRVPYTSPKRTPRITGNRAFDALLVAESQTIVWINLSIECDRPPKGMPDDHEEGVRWLNNAGNLFALLTSLATQEDFSGLNVTDAVALVRAHLLSLPPI